MPKVGMEPIRRHQLIRAAKACLAEMGYEKTTTRDVAERAGVSTGTLVHYFNNKEALLRAALLSCCDEHHRAIEIIKNREEDPLKRLHLIVDYYLSFGENEMLQNWKIWVEFWSQASRVPELGRMHAESYTGWRNTLRSLMGEAAERGLLLEGVDPVKAADTLCALIDGLGLQTVVKDPVIKPEQMKELGHVYLRSLERNEAH